MPYFFNIHNCVKCEFKQFCFFQIWMPFIPFSCCGNLAFDKCLNRSGESKNCCLVPNIRRKPFFILTWNMTLLYIFIDFLYQVQRVPFLVIWEFCHECLLNLFICLSGSINLNTCFSLYSVNVFILPGFCMSILHSWNTSHLVMK